MRRRGPGIAFLTLAALLAGGGSTPRGAAAGAGGELAPSPEAIRPLLVGASVPDVTVRTPDGEPLGLRAAVAGKPSVVIFYRGGW